MIIFDIDNKGQSDVTMFMNIPISQETDKFLASPYVLYREKPTTFKIPVREKPQFKPTTIIFFNGDGRIAALETAGLYVSATGKTQFSDYELWKERSKRIP